MHNMKQHNQLDQRFLNKITFLDSKQRDKLIPPETLISQMPIKKDHTLLDVGAGSGFFTIPMAESTYKKVYALDPDRRMLSVIKAKAIEKGINNIEVIQNSLEDLDIENESIDFVMASLILHEVSSLPDALTKIHEVLKTGGNLLCLEYEKDDLVIEGPPMGIRVSSEELKRLLEFTGFKIVKKNKINNAIYTVLAVKQEV